MTASKPDTESHRVDPDAPPEPGQDPVDGAAIGLGDRVMRRGRPPGSRKRLVSLRLDMAVLEHFRATGPGWQSRINQALREAAGL